MARHLRGVGRYRRRLAIARELISRGAAVYGCAVHLPDRADIARSSVVLAVGAALALIALVVLKRAWRDLECGDAHTVMLDAVITTMVFLAGASVVIGAIAIASHTRVRRSVVVVIVATAILALAFLPSSSVRLDLATYNCGIEVT